MPDLGLLKEGLELLGLVVVVLSPVLIWWGRKHLGVIGLEGRVSALESEEKERTGANERMEKRLGKLDEEIAAIERIDRRLYRVAVLLSQKFPEEAKNIKLLEDL